MRNLDPRGTTIRIPRVSDKTVPRVTHLMHLEENRYALYRETEAFLTAVKD